MIVEPPQLNIVKKRVRPPVPNFEDNTSKKKLDIYSTKSFNSTNDQSNNFGFNANTNNESSTDQARKKLDPHIPVQRGEAAPKVNQDLISALYNKKIKGGDNSNISEDLKMSQKIQTIGTLDEYDPARPNDYEQVLKVRRKKKDHDDLKSLGDEISMMGLQIPMANQELKQVNLANQPVIPRDPGIPEFGDHHMMQNRGAFGQQPTFPNNWGNPPSTDDPQSMMEESINTNFREVEDKDRVLTGQEKAIKIMEKSGWKVGKGIGKEETGMITPLIAVKTSSHSATIKNSAQEQSDILDPEVKQGQLHKDYQEALSNATAIVMLTNQVQPVLYDEQIQVDIESECKSLGAILNIVTFEHSKYPSNSPKSLRVFIQCKEFQTAAFIFAKMNGRFFHGNKVEASFYNEQAFLKGKYDMNY